VGENQNGHNSCLESTLLIVCQYQSLGASNYVYWSFTYKLWSICKCVALLQIILTLNNWSSLPFLWIIKGIWFMWSICQN